MRDGRLCERATTQAGAVLSLVENLLWAASRSRPEGPRPHQSLHGDVLIARADGRRSEEEITIFDSTGLAVQDLAVAVAVYEQAGESGMDVPTIDL